MKELVQVCRDQWLVCCYGSVLDHAFSINVHFVVSLHQCSLSLVACPLQSGIQSLPNGLRIRTHNLLHLLTPLKQQESRHSPNAQLLRNIRHLIYINLVELDRAVFRVVGPLDDLRRDGLARAAPGGETVEEDEVGGGGSADFGLEVAGAVDGVNACGSAGGLGLGGGGGLRCAEFGLVVCYVLCEVVDAHFGGGLFEGFRCGGCEGSRCGEVRCVEGGLMESFGSEW